MTYERGYFRQGRCSCFVSLATALFIVFLSYQVSFAFDIVNETEWESLTHPNTSSTKHRTNNDTDHLTPEQEEMLIHLLQPRTDIFGMFENMTRAVVDDVSKRITQNLEMLENIYFEVIGVNNTIEISTLPAPTMPPPPPPTTTSGPPPPFYLPMSIIKQNMDPLSESGGRDGLNGFMHVPGMGGSMGVKVIPSGTELKDLNIDKCTVMYYVTEPSALRSELTGTTMRPSEPAPTAVPAVTPAAVVLTQVPTVTPTPTRRITVQNFLFTQLDKIVQHAYRGNISGIVDEAMAIAAPPAIRRFVNSVFNTFYCSPERQIDNDC